jgi:hypothetical protein
LRRQRAFREQTDESGNHIGSADDADKESLIDQGSRFTCLVFHERDNVGEGRMRYHREHLLSHHLASFAPARMHAFFRQPPWVDEERDPSGMTLFGAGLGAAKGDRPR